MRWMTFASKEPPPPTTLGAPRERGCPLQRRSFFYVGPPRPSSITHPEVALATVTCSYIVEAGTGEFLAGATRYTT